MGCVLAVAVLTPSLLPVLSAVYGPCVLERLDGIVRYEGEGVNVQN